MNWAWLPMRLDAVGRSVGFGSGVPMQKSMLNEVLYT